MIAVLDRLKERTPDEPPARIIDVGTGSGAIAVTVAKHAPSAIVTAIDLSPAALAVARGNAHSNGVVDRITFAGGDLLATLPSAASFDIVVSNLPYVSDSEYEVLAPEVRDHEPKLALVSGATGVELIGRLIPQAAERLVPGGWLILEISPMIESAVCKLLESNQGWESVRVVKDLAQLARVVQARKRLM